MFNLLFSYNTTAFNNAACSPMWSRGCWCPKLCVYTLTMCAHTLQYKLVYNKGQLHRIFQAPAVSQKRDRQGAEEVSVGVGSPSFKQTRKVGKHRLLWKHLVKSAIWQWGFQQSVTDKWCPVQDFLTSSLGFVSGRLHTGLPGLLYQTAGRKSRRTSLRSQPAEERPALHHCWFPW